MKIITSLIGLCLLSVSCRTTTAPKPNPDSALILFLDQGDTMIVDLKSVGLYMVDQYGKEKAWDTVSGQFLSLSGATLNDATNTMWLVDQSPRVRDLAWLVRFRSEWGGL